ncbi:MAG: hypothetical protein ACOC2F_02045 [Bacteroidota bacterium]
MNLKNIKRVLLIVILFVFLIPLVSHIIWRTQPAQEFNVFMVNKTVTNIRHAEHKSFFWVLNHFKLFKDNGQRYSVKKDYYGFIPLNGRNANQFETKSIGIDQIDSLARVIDLAYFADTYGVFSTEWYQTRYGNASTLIYGGLNLTDYLLLKSLDALAKPVIAEFNFIDYPTNALNNYKVTELYNLDFTGWKGRYFESLDSTGNDFLPKWMIRLYQKTHAGAWPFKADGIILVKGGESIVVLESETHLNSSHPLLLTTPEYIEDYNLPERIRFDKWFQVIEPKTGYDTIANLGFDVNDLGLRELEIHRLNPEFPLVFKRITDGPFIYLAGDFSNNRLPYSTFRFWGIEFFERMFTSKKYGQSAFFWNYYIPLMEGILDDLSY